MPSNKYVGAWSQNVFAWNRFFSLQIASLPFSANDCVHLRQLSFPFKNFEFNQNCKGGWSNIFPARKIRKKIKKISSFLKLSINNPVSSYANNMQIASPKFMPMKIRYIYIYVCRTQTHIQLTLSYSILTGKWNCDRKTNKWNRSGFSAWSKWLPVKHLSSIKTILLFNRPNILSSYAKGRRKTVGEGEWVSSYICVGVSVGVYV